MSEPGAHRYARRADAAPAPAARLSTSAPGRDAAYAVVSEDRAIRGFEDVLGCQGYTLPLPTPTAVVGERQAAHRRMERQTDDGVRHIAQRLSGGTAAGRWQLAVVLVNRRSIDASMTSVVPGDAAAMREVVSAAASRLPGHGGHPYATCWSPFERLVGVASDATTAAGRRACGSGSRHA